MCTGGHGAGGRREDELGEKYRRIHTAMRETASGESSCGGILELRRGSQPSPWVGPGFTY